MTQNKYGPHNRNVDRLLDAGTKAKVRAYGIRHEGLKYRFAGFEGYIGKVVTIREIDGKLLAFDSKGQYIGTLDEDNADVWNAFAYYQKLSYRSGMAALGILAEIIMQDIDRISLDEPTKEELILILCADISVATASEKAETDILAATFEMMNLYKRLEKVLAAAPELLKELSANS